MTRAHAARPFTRATLALAGLALGLAACAPQPRLTASGAARPSRAVVAACRQQVDRAYTAQNRAELSQRDQRDTPLSDSYVSGITSRGLSSAFGRDTDLASCIRNSEPATPSAIAPAANTPAANTPAAIGPTFTPVGK